MNHQFSRAFFVVAALIWIVPGLLWAQGTIDRDHVPSKERVDDLERRKDVVDGNNVRATITNYLQTAQSGEPGDIFYEWPKNTNRIYIALTQLWVGSEVEDDNGNRLYIVDLADFRNNLNNETNAWNFRPIKGYVNPGGRDFGIAQSDERDSWPPFWPDKLEDDTDAGWAGSWNGFFGKDIFNADQEFFYKAGDDQYDRYPSYFPDSTDLTRKGLGLIVDTRVMVWSQILIDDVVFLLHAIKNDGSKPLDKVGTSIWLADLVGGDSDDDIPFFDVTLDVAWMTDADGIGTEPFGADPVGVAAIAFLETPGNAVDRIDNDGDGSTSVDCDPVFGECNSPIVPEEFLAGECPATVTGIRPRACFDGIDNNGNGLIDESGVHIPFSDEQSSSPGVGYADRIDNDLDGESGSPVVTDAMIGAAASDIWKRWPPNPETDPMQQDASGKIIVHLIGVDEDDLDAGFRDFIDNDDSHVNPAASMSHPAEQYLSEPGSPVVTQAMVDQAASDPYGRYKVPGTRIILYAVGPEDLGKAYADGLDNDEDGSIDEGIDELIDEMIDESRADGIDNDGDWDLFRDDTGLDGVGFTGDPGDGDGTPTSGAGTDFPGEKNIDFTDISESDQIGITNVQIIPAFFLNFNTNSDQFLFNSFMIPGDLDTEQPPPGENDLVVSSGIFPLLPGQTERISLAIALGENERSATDSRDNALQAYSEDYQFAQAPLAPTVTAVPGDGRVTLYWDTAAEESFDQFLDGLGLPARDFEGYRIYRASDPAFLDVQTITDGFGNRLYRSPIAQFDMINGNEGFHPVDINGVKFYMGNDSQDPGEARNGLQHSFIDDDVENGVTYFYAVTSYDFGAANANIPPTESPIRIRRLPDGTIETGKNVVQVVPNAPVSGYEGADVRDAAISRTKGLTSSTIGYRIVDPTIIENNRYRISFEDTLIAGTLIAPDTLTTKNFTLTNLTTGDVMLSRSRGGLGGTEFPTYDENENPIGFELLFMNESFVGFNSGASVWKDDEDNYPISFDPYSGGTFVRGFRNPADYRLKIVGDQQGQSIELKVRNFITLPARPTNVQVVRLEPDGAGGTVEVPVEYAYWDLSGPDFVSPFSTEPATFTTDPAIGETDLIILYEPKVGGDPNQKFITWRIGLNFTFQGRQNPQSGDVIDIITRKPFLQTDEFEFETVSSDIDAEVAASVLDEVIVVPNPYVATNRFEPLNPYTTGRGPRVIKFMNLPATCTVRIYTVSGKLVTTLERNDGPNSPDALLDGSISWNLESNDNLSVAYGVYVYHVEAPGIGETQGTFAIIK